MRCFSWGAKSMKYREQILEQVKQIPALPVSAIVLIRLLQDPDAQPSLICKAVKHDPGLTSNILRLANSSLFGVEHEIGSIKEALVRLGTKNILSLVLCSTVAPMAKKTVPGYNLQDGALWEHSVATALATGEFAEILDVRSPDIAFTAGLLCNIGKIVIGTFVEKESEAIYKLAFEDNLSFQCAEQEVLGVDHAEIGADLLESWGLPGSVVEVVRWHHEPDRCPEEYQATADIVHVAEHGTMVIGYGVGDEGTHYKVSSESSERLKLNAKWIEAALCQTVIKLEEVRDSLGVSVGNVQN